MLILLSNPHRIQFSTFFILVFFITGILTACGGGSTEDEATINSSRNLIESDYELSSITPLSTVEFKAELNDTEEFISEEEDILNSSSDELACMIDKIGNITYQRKSNNTYELSINDTNLTECFVIAGVVMKSVVASWYGNNLRLIDASGNEADAETISFKDFQNYTITQSNSRIYMKMQYIITFNRFSYNVEATLKVSSNETGKFNEPCQFETIFTNCTYTDIFQIIIDQLPSENSEIKKVLHAEDLKIEPDKQYYAEGQIQFEINNWSGTMSYQNASTPPTYTANDGAETITGSLESSHTHKLTPDTRIFRSNSKFISENDINNYATRVISDFSKAINLEAR